MQLSLLWVSLKRLAEGKSRLGASWRVTGWRRNKRIVDRRCEGAAVLGARLVVPLDRHELQIRKGSNTFITVVVIIERAVTRYLLQKT